MAQNAISAGPVHRVPADLRKALLADLKLTHYPPPLLLAKLSPPLI
jgi:hypothetical protein